jgi:MFS family permease
MYRKNVKLLKIFNFLVGFSLFAPFAIIYFSRVAGSFTLGASVFAIVMLSSALFEVPTGIWSDRVGRKGTIILGSICGLIGIVLYAVGLSYLWLVGGAIFEGLARSFYSGNNDAFLHDTLADDGVLSEYDEHLGKSMAFEHAGIAISAVIGGFIANYSFTYLMWLAVIPQLLLVFVSTLFVKSRTREAKNSNIYSHLKEAIKLFIRNKKLRALSIADAVSFSTGEVSFQFRAAFFNSIWPVWAIGALNTTLQIGATVSYYFSAQLVKRIGHEKLLLIRSISGKISGLIAFGVSHVFAPLITIFPSFLYGAGQVAKNTLMQREFTDHQRATMSSLNSLLSSLSYAIMSVLVGFFADQTSPQTALLILTIIGIPIVAIYWNIFSKKGLT